MKILQTRPNASRIFGLIAVLALSVGLLLSCATPSIEAPGSELNTEADQANVDQAEAEEDAEANTLPDAADADAAAEDAADEVAVEADAAEVNTTEAEAAEADASSAGATGAAQVASVSDELYKGMTVGFTQEGFAFRGDPEAPVVLYEYSDYECPFCNRHAQQVEPLLNDAYVLEGTTRVIFRDFPLTSLHPNAPVAHAAALCAADTSANAFWQMHDSLFDTQGEWSALGSIDERTAYFAELGADVGLDAEALTACIESGEKSAQIAASAAEAQALGYNSTPSFQLVNSEADLEADVIGAQPFETFASFIDGIAAGNVPCGLPEWACADGLAPDPDRPGITMAGDFYHGDPSAETVVVEFSDFQCGFCRRHTQETQPLIDENFVETGDIFWVFKQFPALGPASQEAAVAAECAAYQGEFEPMKTALFDRFEEWSRGESTPVFVEMAAELGLDTDEYASCLEDPATLESVAADYGEGQSFVQGTPTFVVIQGENGQLVQGALPYERFEEILTLAVEEGLPD